MDITYSIMEIKELRCSCFMGFILKMYNKYKDIILYLFFGIATTIINIFTYAFFTKVFCIGYLASNVLSWIISVAFAFFTNKIFVFESKISSKSLIIKEFLLFYYYRLLSLIIEMILLYVFVDRLQTNDLLMKIITNIIVIILNYFFSKFKVFKNK